jgi:hypothetical protein
VCSLIDGDSASRKNSGGFFNICRRNEERVSGLLWQLRNIWIRESVEACWESLEICLRKERRNSLTKPVLVSECIILRASAIKSSSFSYKWRTATPRGVTTDFRTPLSLSWLVIKGLLWGNRAVGYFWIVCSSISKISCCSAVSLTSRVNLISTRLHAKMCIFD